MTIGEKIYSSNTHTTYTIFQTLKSGGQAECAYATSGEDETTFFIKRLLTIRYSEDGELARKCKAFENNSKKVYREINKETLPGGTCSYIHDFFREKTFYYIVMEKIDAIEFDITQLSKVMPIEDKLFFFRIIAYGFLPLEHASIIHADVKPENILMKHTGEQYVPKLIDFESAFHTNYPPEKGFIVGTAPYYSPELAEYNIEGNNVDASVLTTKSDIFSLGVMLYEFLTGESIIKEYGKCAYELVRDGCSVKMKNDWSSDLCSLIESMLSKNPSHRPDAMNLFKRLKNLEDVSHEPNSITTPAIFIRHENNKVAYVSFLSLNKNVRIQYNADNKGWLEYNKPFTIDDDDIELDIKILLIRHSREADEKIFHYEVSVSRYRSKKVVRPTIIIEDGRVTIECVNEKAITHYTLDGTTPNKKSPIYRGAFQISDNVIIKAYARCVGLLPSDVISKNSSSKILSS